MRFILKMIFLILLFSCRHRDETLESVRLNKPVEGHALRRPKGPIRLEELKIIDDLEVRIAFEKKGVRFILYTRSQKPADHYEMAICTVSLPILCDPRKKAPKRFGRSPHRFPPPDLGEDTLKIFVRACANKSRIVDSKDTCGAWKEGYFSLKP